MKKYRVDTSNWSSKEYTDIEKALGKYELTKDLLMGEGVDMDGYVELVSSDNDFDDYEIVKQATIVVDEEKMAQSSPREKGYDFDIWAKWKETILEAEKNESNGV